jgi:hypothetical protein
MLEHMRSLSPSPYRYGSESAISQLPRFNDLGLFTEFAIANTVLEEPEPVREPRLRIENQYGGIGFVGDIGSGEHVVRRGELSASMHLAPLLQRCRGRIVASWVDADATVEQTMTAGSVAAAADGWTLEPHDGGSAVSIPLDATGERRVHAVGFVLSLHGPARLSLTHAEGDTASTAVEVRLGAGSTYAGVVEVDATPALSTRLDLRVSHTEAAVIHDLFVIAYG